MTDSRPVASDSEAHAAATFRRMVEGGWDVFVLLDGEGKIKYASDAITQVLGYSQEEYRAFGAFALVHPDDLEEAQRKFAQLLEEPDTSLRVEVRAKHKDGSYRWLEVLGSNRLADPAVGAIIANFRDVTDRKETEGELEQSLSLLRATLESTADGLLVVDNDGKIVLYNRKFVEMWRIPDQILALRDDNRALEYAIQQLEEPEEFLRRVRKLYGDPDAESCDVLRFKDGRVFERYSQPQRVGGRSVGRVWSFRDVTEQRRAEQAVRTSEASYRALVEHATYGIYRSTPEGHFQSVNPALVRMLRYDSAEDLMSADIATDIYMHPAERKELIARYSDAEKIEEVEVEWRRKDGTPILVRLSGRPIHSPSGEVESFEMIAEDVTDRRALEAQLRQAQKMEAIGQLTGGIAHDFNNLLTVILANADIIERGLPEESKRLMGDLADLRRAAQRGSEMIKKLLGFSRRGMLVLRPIKLAEVVGGVLPTLRRVLPENISVRFTVRDRTSVVDADEGALEQILFNLATNARDAMPEGGTIRIEVKRATLDREHRALQGWGEPGEYLLLSFSDTGQGMDEATRERIFDPFFTTKPPGLGTGLGMAMIYGLIKQQDGFVDVRSEVGKGTVVELYFPLMPEGTNVAETAHVSQGGHSGTETILLVEDEASIRRSAKRLLEHQGYTVMLASDGEEALELFRKQGGRIDLVISDVVMPRMGGAQLYKALKRQRRNVRFLFTSGYTVRDRASGGVLDPRVPFLHKPWDVDELLRRVRELLDRN